MSHGATIRCPQQPRTLLQLAYRVSTHTHTVRVCVYMQDLRRFLRWASVHLGYPSLADVEAAPPTAELEPLREGIKPQVRVCVCVCVRGWV